MEKLKPGVMCEAKKTGSFDVDDIILNLAGSLCGYLMFLLSKSLLKRL